jgi:hypothetical protein
MNSAAIYRHLRDDEKAEFDASTSAPTVLRNILPPQDRQIAWTLNTLAPTYRKQGRFEEATALHEAALACQNAILGEFHPYTLLATMDKAGCYRGQGRLEASAALLPQGHGWVTENRGVAARGHAAGHERSW